MESFKLAQNYRYSVKSSEQKEQGKILETKGGN